MAQKKKCFKNVCSAQCRGAFAMLLPLDQLAAIYIYIYTIKLHNLGGKYNTSCDFYTCDPRTNPQ
jgi:hypothetical protein